MEQPHSIEHILCPKLSLRRIPKLVSPTHPIRISLSLFCDQKFISSLSIRVSFFAGKHHHRHLSWLGQADMLMCVKSSVMFACPTRPWHWSIIWISLGGKFSILHRSKSILLRNPFKVRPLKIIAFMIRIHDEWYSLCTVSGRILSLPTSMAKLV